MGKRVCNKYGCKWFVIILAIQICFRLLQVILGDMGGIMFVVTFIVNLVLFIRMREEFIEEALFFMPIYIWMLLLGPIIAIVTFLRIVTA